MDEYKISQAEINENNVKSAADIVSAEDYGGNAREVKGIFDKLPELIVSRFNGFVDSVITKFTDYYNKTEVDAKETALSDRIDEKADADNVYTKDETFTKAETEQYVKDIAFGEADINLDGVVYYGDGGEDIEVEDDTSVKFTPQQLTEEQKAVARENIGADEIDNYEIIESFILEENVAQIVRTDVKYKKVMITAKTPMATNTDICLIVIVTGGGQLWVGGTTTNSSYTKSSRWEIFPRDGQWAGEFQSEVVGWGSGACKGKGNPHEVIPYNADDYIYYVRLYATSNSIPAGSEIQLLGVRA